MVAASGCSYAAWKKSLRNLANVLAITIVNHFQSCGKKGIGQKGYGFFTEKDVHNAFVKEAVEEGCRQNVG